jgi:hypothetical protein
MSENGLGEEQLSFLSEMLGEETSGETSEQSEILNVEEPVEESLELASVEIEKTPEIVEESLDSGEQDNLRTIESLREQILALSQAVGNDPKLQSVQQNVSAESEASAAVGTLAGVDPKTSIEQFLTVEELDRLIDEPGLINVAFTRSFTAMQANVQASIQREVNRQILVNRAVTDFYQANEDLLPYSKFVQFVMSEVEQSNKDKPYSEIFQTTASECRKRLGLSIGAKAPTRESNNGSQKPAFAGSKKSNSRPVQQKEMFDKNAMDMMSLMD